MAKSINKTYPEKIMLTTTAHMKGSLETIARAQGIPVRQVVRNLLASAMHNAPDYAPEDHLGFNARTMDNLRLLAELRGRSVKDIIHLLTIASLTVSLINAGHLLPVDTTEENE